MTTATDQQHVLCLAKPGSKAHEFLSRLGPDMDVQVVQSFEEALAALRDHRFDLVVSDQGDFVALERAAVNHRASTILETIGQGVCIIDPQGKCVWSNPHMKTYPADVSNQICEAATRTRKGPDRDENKPAHARSRRFSLHAGDDQYFDVTVTPVLNHQNEIVQYAAVVLDVTHSCRLQRKIDAIDLAGRELVGLDAETISKMHVEDRISLLEEKMLRYMHDLLEYDNFAVLLIDKKTNRLEIVLQHGMSSQSREFDIFASAENNGISGYVAATGRSYICHDTSKDPRYLKGLESAKSSLTVPIRLHDKLIGVFNIESDRLAAFNEDDRQFAEIMARYIGLALNTLDLLVYERFASTGRLAADVSCEIAGPLNDILTEASTLIEEYIGNDDLRRRLNAICDRVTDIKTCVKEVATPRGGLLGRTSDTVEKDSILNDKNILVCDDEEVIRETVGGVLRKYGCNVETAADGLQALNMLDNRKYDLVLADIRMPHKNGYEVFAAARDADPNIGVILMTGFGYDPHHSVIRARKEGLNAVLFKPFKVEELLKEIRTALQPHN